MAASSSSPTRRNVGNDAGMMPGMMPGDAGNGGRGWKSYAPPTQSGRSRVRRRLALKEGTDVPGFIVVIEGYSPYRNINDLLDPAGVRQMRPNGEW